MPLFRAFAFGPKARTSAVSRVIDASRLSDAIVTARMEHPDKRPARIHVQPAEAGAVVDKRWRVVTVSCARAANDVVTYSIVDYSNAK